MSQPQPNPNATSSSVPEASAVSANDETISLSRTPNGEPVEMPRFAPPTQAGELGRLGKYRIQKELGRGGMGAVYLAFDERLQRKIALKVMLPKAAAIATAKERFLREARAAAQISSDHVVNIHEADEIDGTPYIALQFLQGHPLDEYLSKQGSPSLPQIIRIGQETALGLAAAHQLSLVHRDIKPGNLWLEAPNGRVKILDFGLARQQDDDVHLTRSGAVVGTPAYMSPEQGRGSAVDGRSDLFSLGGVLYRLCAGRLPFKGDTTMALLMAIGMDEPTPVRELNQNLPEPLANLIHRLLAKDPAQRPPTAQAVADELNAISDWLTGAQAARQMPVVYAPNSVQASNPFERVDPSSEMSQSVTQTHSEVEPPSRKPFPTKLVASLLFAVLVVVGAAVFLTSGGKKPDPDTAINTPDPTPPMTTPKKPETTNDPDRLAAKYVLSIGGAVVIDGIADVIKNPSELPQGSLRLTVARLNGNQHLTDTGLAIFKDCKNLLQLDLHSSNVSDTGLANLKDCKHLRQLYLASTKVTDTGLANFKDCKILTHLHLHDTQVGDVGLAHFKDCTQLTHLTLYITKVSDAGLAYFKDCTQLKELNLAHTQVGNAGLAHFKDCTQLTDLRLRDTKVGDVGLATLKDCKQLTLLWLDGTMVSDATLKALRDWTMLTELKVQKTQVTAAGVKELATALPQCKIEWDGPTIEPMTKKP